MLQIWNYVSGTSEFQQKGTLYYLTLYARTVRDAYWTTTLPFFCVFVCCLWFYLFNLKQAQTKPRNFAWSQPFEKKILVHHLPHGNKAWRKCYKTNDTQLTGHLLSSVKMSLLATSILFHARASLNWSITWFLLAERSFKS